MKITADICAPTLPGGKLLPTNRHERLKVKKLWDTDVYTVLCKQQRQITRIWVVPERKLRLPNYLSFYLELNAQLTSVM